MQTINLIPFPRLDARSRRAHRAWCALGCAAYGLGALAVAMAAHLTWGRSDPNLATQLVDAAKEVEALGKSIASVKADSDAAQAMLRASQNIVEQPDWSALLALVASTAGPEIVLKGCTVRPRDADHVAPPPPDPKRPAAKTPLPPVAEPVLVVGLTGRGQSQQVVSRFVLRLEATGLFGKVTQVETTREPGEGGDTIGFRVDCSLEDPGPAAARAALTAAQEGR